MISLPSIVKSFAMATLIMLIASASSNAALDRPFQEMANEILSGLDAVALDQLPAKSGYGVPVIAVRPFDKGNTAADSGGYNRRLLSALQQQAKGRFGFVSTEALDTLLNDVQQSGLPQNEVDSRIADLKASSRADVMINGSVRLENGQPLLSYQAASTETARIFVTTTPRPLPDQVNTTRHINPAYFPVPGFSRVVAETESLLQDLGYDPGPVDGFMTAKTRSALSAYQTDSALPVNGRMTRRAVENMRRDTR